MDKLVVKELIQDDLTSVNLVTELTDLLNDKQRINSLSNNYKELKNILSAGGHASAKAAKSIYQFVIIIGECVDTLFIIQ